METFDRHPTIEVPVQTDAREVEKPAHASKRKPTARNLVLGAIRQLKNAKGSSFADIKKYLGEKYDSNDIADVNTLKTFVEGAVANGILEKTNSRYKIMEAAKKGETSGGKNTVKHQIKSGSKKSASASKAEKGSSKLETRKKQKSARKEVKPEAKKRTRKAETDQGSK